MPYHIVKDGQQRGPYSQMQVIELLREGALTSDDLAWETGMAAWLPLGKLLAFEASPTAPVPEVPQAAVPSSPAFPSAARQQNVDETLLADRVTRLLASLVDSAVGTALLLPGILLMLRVIPPDQLEKINAEYLSQHADEYGTAFAVFGLGALVMMAIQFSMLTRLGQTVGKKVMGVKIVTVAGQRNPGFVKAVLMRGFVPAVVACMPVIGSVFSLVDVLFIFREDRRCIHDLIAETMVVKVRPAAAGE